jgi:hypothetical protein
MFSTPQTLERRTGQNGVARFDYLKQLVHEFNNTDLDDYKQQILANLANFAYDPINYEYFRRLNIIDLFLNTIKNYPLNNENNIKKISFAISGICNLCLDEKNKEYLIKNNLSGLLRLILSTFKNNDIILINILTIFIFINNDQIRNEIINDEYLINVVKNLVLSKNKCLSNFAIVFLEDFK